MSYLLGTDVCIAHIRGRPTRARAEFAEVVQQKSQVYVSSMSLFELWYGCAKSQSPERNAERLAVFMARPTLLDFTEEDAAAAGHIRAELEAQGRPIGAYDLLLAGQARQRGLTLVTCNIS